MNGLLRASIVSAMAAGVLIAGYFGLERDRPAKAKPQLVKVAAAANPVRSRRERTARLVAETAAATADRTARAALAKKVKAQETAAR